MRKDETSVQKALVVAIIASITFSMAFLPTLACVDYVPRKIPPIVSTYWLICNLGRKDLVILDIRSPDACELLHD